MNRRESQLSNVFRDAVIGFGDGMIIPFALAAALTYIDVHAKDVIIVSLVVITAGSLLMAIAGFFSGQELQAPGHSHHHHGLDLPEELKQEVEKEKEEELQFLSSINPDSSDPAKSAWIIGTFHLFGGVISLLPYFLLRENSEALSVSLSVMPILLFATGYVRHSGPGRKPLSGGFRTMIIGLLTAAGACAVAVLFRA